MPLFRSIFILMALLAQAWPAALGTRSFEDEACEMACCAWQKKAVAVQTDPAACGCIESPAAPVSQTSPSTPPPASGRDLIPTPLWVSLDATDLVPLSWRELSAEAPLALADRLHSTQPQIRLTVLFCSFLT